MSRIGMMRAPVAEPDVACIALRPRVGTMGNPQSFRELTPELRDALRIVAGDIELDTSCPALLVVRPGSKAVRYGGPLGWGRTVRAYLVGRGRPARIVLGFDRDRVRAVATQGAPGLVVFGSVEQEIAATAALAPSSLPALRGLPLGDLRTVGALARASSPGLASARRYAASLLGGGPQLAFDPASARRSA